jgi:N-acetylglucosaminyl-diphospho-decaprenol L-rhamnosyltransferase
VVIVAFNARDDLARTLETLTADGAIATPHDVVVVDNASTDGASELVRSRFPAVTLIEPGQNLGFARASNVGIRATASELVLLLNPDTLVPPGAVDRLVAILDANPDIAAVGPRIVDGNGDAELSWGETVTPWRELGRKLVARLDTAGIGAVRRHAERKTSVPRDVAWLTGACLLVRRTDAEAVGLLDEQFFLYMEDVDFCQALAARGRRVRFEAGVEIVHLRGRSRPAQGGVAERAWHHSQLAYYRKRLPRWAPWLERYQRLRGLGP